MCTAWGGLEETTRTQWEEALVAGTELRARRVWTRRRGTGRSGLKRGLIRGGTTRTTPISSLLAPSKWDTNNRTNTITKAIQMLTTTLASPISSSRASKLVPRCTCHRAADAWATTTNDRDGSEPERGNSKWVRLILYVSLSHTLN